MTHQKVTKQHKPSATKKITGAIIDLNKQQITLKTVKGLFVIRRTAETKVVKGTLKLGSTVTVEANKILAGPQPGKRTETGTVIGLTAQHIRLDNTMPDAGPWIVTRTNSTRVLSGVLALNSSATVESNDGDWQLDTA
jgi:hypothetical protein